MLYKKLKELQDFVAFSGILIMILMINLCSFRSKMRQLKICSPRLLGRQRNQVELSCNDIPTAQNDLAVMTELLIRTVLTSKLQKGVRVQERLKHSPWSKS